MLRKKLWRLRHGDIAIKTILDKNYYRPGEQVSGKVIVQGGIQERIIKELVIQITTKMDTRDDLIYSRVPLLKTTIAKERKIEIGEKLEFSFSFQVPYDTPIAVHNVKESENGDKDLVSKGFFHISIDTICSLDKWPNWKEYNEINVFPHPWVQKVIEALQKELGFSLSYILYQFKNWQGYKKNLKTESHVSIDNMRMNFNSFYTYSDEKPFMFIYDFKPIKEILWDKMDEIQIIFQIKEDQLLMYIQIDRRGEGVKGVIEDTTDKDEKYIQLSLRSEELEKDAHDIAKWFLDKFRDFFDLRGIENLDELKNHEENKEVLEETLNIDHISLSKRIIASLSMLLLIALGTGGSILLFIMMIDIQTVSFWFKLLLATIMTAGIILLVMIYQFFYVRILLKASIIEYWIQMRRRIKRKYVLSLCYWILILYGFIIGLFMLCCISSKA
ncbi:MAG: sporulation protein [Bacillaceae bacterium]|nr:sporulation protein [Bacillaceae bacterium]